MSVKVENKGFSVIELVIILVVVGLVGYMGYIFVSRQNSNANNQSAVATDVQGAPQIKSTTDLTNAEKLLDSADLDQKTDNAELDSVLADF